MTEDFLSEQYRLTAIKWVDADAAASLLEETKSAFFSQQLQFYLSNDMAVNRAEHIVKASPAWTDYITKAVNLRKDANLYKVELEYIRMKFFEQNSSEATRRHEMRL